MPLQGLSQEGQPPFSLIMGPSRPVLAPPVDSREEGGQEMVLYDLRPWEAVAVQQLGRVVVGSVGVDRPGERHHQWDGEHRSTPDGYVLDRSVAHMTADHLPRADGVIHHRPTRGGAW